MPREVSVRELRNNTAQVVAALRAGEQLSLTVNRLPVADIVPFSARPNPWLQSGTLRRIVQECGADSGLMTDLAEIRSETIDDS